MLRAYNPLVPPDTYATHPYYFDAESENEMSTNIAVAKKSKLDQDKDYTKPSVFGQVKLKNTRSGNDKLEASNKVQSPKKETNPFGSVKLRKTNSSISDKAEQPVAQPVYEKNALRASKCVAKKETSADEDVSLVVGLSAKLDTDKSNDKFLKKANEMLSQILSMNDEGAARRRLSTSDNDLVNYVKNPRHTEITVDSDPRMDHIKPSIVVGFAEDLRINLNLRRLSMRNVSLGNEFLSSVSDSIRSSFVLEALDLSRNSFTSDALIEFCLAMADNRTLLHFDLGAQHSPIFSQREDIAIEALSKNKSCHTMVIEFQTEGCQEKVKKIEERNKANPKTIVNLKKKVTSMLETELELATKRQSKRNQVKTEIVIDEGDMPYLYELYERANRLKLPYETSTSTCTNSFLPRPSGTKTSLAKISSNLLTPDGSFLTPEFISRHLVVGNEDQSLTFEFNNQSKIFKRFAPTDPARPTIVRLLVESIVNHERACNITHLNLANAVIGDDFVEGLCKKCLGNPELLSSLHLINMESNLISDNGVMALTNVLRCPRTWKYLQAIKLDNQHRPLSTVTENELSAGLGENKSLIKLSLRIRNTFERQEINSCVIRNVDFLRQARVWHGKKTGTTKQRARNRVEKMFDQVAANDGKVKEVELVADRLFLSLHPTERIKAAKSFASNSTVTKLKMTGLELDDAFACEMAKSLEMNTTLEIVELEQNKIGSDGQIALVKSLASNRVILELKLRHQSKSMSSSCEESIPEILSSNDVVVKLGLDVRSIMARNSMDKKLRQNQTLRRKQLASKK